MNNKGFVLFYIIFIFVLVLNIFIFNVLYNLNKNNYFNDKDKYYHVFILEERAKRHIKERFLINQPINNETEILSYENNYIFLLYKFDDMQKLWCINYQISYQDINQKGIIYYDNLTGEIFIEIQ